MAETLDPNAAQPGAPARSPRRRVLLRALLLAGSLLLLLLALAAVRIGPLLLAPNEYAGTPSIEQRADYRSPDLMRQAWSLPVAASYRSAGFMFQSNQSFCGPASVANALRSLGVDTDQHKVIDGTRHEPWFGILVGGLTLDELSDLARSRTSRPVDVVRPESLAEFRRILLTANDPSRRIIVNFHRGPLFGRGHGHHSPILGYLASHDLVLVGDVNAEFRPFLVRSGLLWHAIDTVDTETGRKRGLLLIGSAQGIRPLSNLDSGATLP